jgi:hypothetical protein
MLALDDQTGLNTGTLIFMMLRIYADQIMKIMIIIMLCVLFLANFRPLQPRRLG